MARGKSAPRRGSLQFWPRVRAKRIYPRIRNWAPSTDAKPLGFAGYKVGMAHIQTTDNRKTKLTKGQTLNLPVTIIECPPLVVYGVRLYRNDMYGKHQVADIMIKPEKELLRKVLKSNKQRKIDSVKIEEFDDLKLIVHTMPKLTGFGKKKPEIFEVAVGGSKEDQLNYAKTKLGKEFKIEEIFKEGDIVDIHAVTTGKGTQGPVKRFGVAIRNHKSEKTKRGPGSLGPWHPAKVSFKVPHFGQMGFHTRVEYNKQILKIGLSEEDMKMLDKKSGHHNYGLIKNTYVLIKGSVGGSKKRLVRFKSPVRPNVESASLQPNVEKIII